MNPYKAQIFWSSIVAIGVALMALYSTFSGNTSVRPFSETSIPAATSNLIHTPLNIR